MGTVLGAQAFNRLDLGAVGLNGKCQAGPDAVAVHQYRASATDTVLAADMGTGEIKSLADKICQQQPGLNLGRMDCAVNGHRDGNSVRHAPALFDATSKARLQRTPARCRR